MVSVVIRRELYALNTIFGRTAFQALVGWWLAITVVFFALRIAPTNALVARLVESEASAAEIDNALEKAGLNAPLLLQYGQYVVQLARGDWGRSLANEQSVRLLIEQRLPVTVVLASISLMGSVTVGVCIGVILAVSTSNALNAVIRTYVTLSVSIPVYWSATIALFIIAGALGLSRDSWLLPLLLLIFHLTGTTIRVTAVAWQNTVAMTYVTFAKSKGLSARRIMWRHEMPLVLAQVMPVLTTQAALLLGSMVTIEVVFGRAGMGQLMVQAVLQRDYPVVQGVTVVLASIALCISLSGQLFISWLDPRMRIV